MSDLTVDPIAQFSVWFNDAKSMETKNPEAMTLATASSNGRPSARMVLLKEFSADGFIFYTNLNSNKALELSENSQAALCFYWRSISRQVRIEGPVMLVSEKRADAYFASRSRGSKIGAWASDQSKNLTNRSLLEQRVKDYESKFSGVEVPRPSFWSGYQLKPELIEFWTERDNRTHERQLYKFDKNGVWQVSSLYP
jgi:pyridoxamine 5'-phosphate oxidase|tara:strand:- start:314 stop:904 length:591 start_codon:yes stop_codon:yes gene_type:complete